MSPLRASWDSESDIVIIIAGHLSCDEYASYMYMYLCVAGAPFVCSFGGARIVSSQFEFASKPRAFCCIVMYW